MSDELARIRQQLANLSSAPPSLASVTHRRLALPARPAVLPASPDGDPMLQAAVRTVQRQAASDAQVAAAKREQAMAMAATARAALEAALAAKENLAEQLRAEREATAQA